MYAKKENNFNLKKDVKSITYTNTRSKPEKEIKGLLWGDRILKPNQSVFIHFYICLHLEVFWSFQPNGQLGSSIKPPLSPFTSLYIPSPIWNYGSSDFSPFFLSFFSQFCNQICRIHFRQNADKLSLNTKRHTEEDKDSGLWEIEGNDFEEYFRWEWEENELQMKWQ